VFSAGFATIPPDVRQNGAAIGGLLGAVMPVGLMRWIVT
jgi:hypothetical protein